MLTEGLLRQLEATEQTPNEIICVQETASAHSTEIPWIAATTAVSDPAPTVNRVNARAHHGFGAIAPNDGVATNMHRRRVRKKMDGSRPFGRTQRPSVGKNTEAPRL